MDKTKALPFGQDRKQRSQQRQNSHNSRSSGTTCSSVVASSPLLSEGEQQQQQQSLHQSQQQPQEPEHHLHRRVSNNTNAGRTTIPTNHNNKKAKPAEWLAKYQVEVPVDLLSGADSECLSLPPGYQPSRNDIICGRGRGYYNCAGNVRFRNLVEQHVELYASQSSKTEKTAVLDLIAQQVKTSSLGSNHRGTKFIKQDPETGEWCELGPVATREKVGNAMREAMSARNYSNRTNLNKKVATCVKTSLRNLFVRKNSSRSNNNGNPNDNSHDNAPTQPTVTPSSSLKNATAFLASNSSMMDGASKTYPRQQAILAAQQQLQHASDYDDHDPSYHDDQQRRCQQHQHQEQEQERPLLQRKLSLLQKQRQQQLQQEQQQEQQYQHPQQQWSEEQQHDDIAFLMTTKEEDHPHHYLDCGGTAGPLLDFRSSSSSSSCQIIFGRRVASLVDTSACKDHSLASSTMSGTTNDSISSWMMDPMSTGTHSSSSFMVHAAKQARLHQSPHHPHHQHEQYAPQQQERKKNNNKRNK